METPRAAYDAAEDMEFEEKGRFVNSLMEQIKEYTLENQAMRSVLEAFSGKIDKLLESSKDMADQLKKTIEELRAVKAELNAANKRAQKYEAMYTRERQNRSDKL